MKLSKLFRSSDSSRKLESSGLKSKAFFSSLGGAFISLPQDVARSLLDTLGVTCSLDDVLCSSTITTVAPSRATDAFELAVVELLGMSSCKSGISNGGEERGDDKAHGWEMLGLPLR